LNPKIKKIVSVIAVLGLFAAGFIYFKFFTSNTSFNEEKVYVFIPSNSNYEEAKNIISPYIKDYSGFEMLAKNRKYDKNVKSGRFLLEKGMSSFQLVRALRQNVPVKLAFNNQERLENFVQRVASQIEPDSLQLMNAITNPDFMRENGFDKNTAIGMFLPNSYEIYWNTSAEKFRDKMLKEYKSFWTAERLEKAKNLNMTPIQVETLASIVHKESVKADERPRIAGVYLNRLNLGMPLQADPTVIYAKKLSDNDFNQVIKRVAGPMLSINSAYNTYVNQGLPPGPIAMPDLNAVDAVLNYEKHDYIYFCASVERFGYHDFASNYAQHQINATKYARWLNEQGIKR
jgi:UPF0755 protein